jgi:hypothetical protein
MDKKNTREGTSQLILAYLITLWTRWVGCKHVLYRDGGARKVTTVRKKVRKKELKKIANTLRGVGCKKELKKIANTLRGVGCKKELKKIANTLRGVG